MRKLLVAILLAIFPSFVLASGWIEVEAGGAFTGYNDVRIPADSGTLISLKDDAGSSSALALRMRTGFTFKERHSLLLLAAPLTVKGQSTLDKTISYQGIVFTAGTKISSVYTFNSFRMTYRYAFYRSEKLVMAAGLTGKIRQADIAIMSATGYGHRDDLGAVPLIHFMLDWKFSEKVGFLLDTDALWSPFGRAEDLLLAFRFFPKEDFSWRIGYRLLEGGADGGGNVYTFSLFHYAVIGLSSGF
jgi:hypothetical protein